MEDLYFNYNPEYPGCYTYDTNFTQKMLSHIDEFADEEILFRIQSGLQEINLLGDRAKKKYIKECEKTGCFTFNAPFVYYWITKPIKLLNPIKMYIDFYDMIGRKYYEAIKMQKGNNI